MLRCHGNFVSLQGDGARPEARYPEKECNAASSLHFLFLFFTFVNWLLFCFLVICIGNLLKMVLLPL